MPESSSNQPMLLNLLEGIAQTSQKPLIILKEIPQELEDLMRKFVSAGISESEELSSDEESQLNTLAAQNPESVKLLHALLHEVESIESLGTIPETILQAQLDKVLGKQKASSTAFSVRLKNGFISYGIKPTRRIMKSFDMARDAGDQCSILQHTQKLDHFEILVTVEAEANKSLALQLEFTFIAPSMRANPIEVVLTNRSTGNIVSEILQQKEIRFEKLEPGNYAIDFVTDEKVVDLFYMELKSD